MFVQLLLARLGCKQSVFDRAIDICDISVPVSNNHDVGISAGVFGFVHANTYIPILLTWCNSLCIAVSIIGTDVLFLPVLTMRSCIGTV